MLLQELHIDWKQDTTFKYKFGLIKYLCKVKYLPFGLVNKVDYEKKDLSKIYTPVFHFEFIAVNTDKKAYTNLIGLCLILWLGFWRIILIPISKIWFDLPQKKTVI